MKLLPFTDFTKHSKFMPMTGLCCNLYSVYGPKTGNEFGPFLLKNGFMFGYPVGKDGFNKTHELNNDSKALYMSRRSRGTLYVGTQYKLRRKLYTMFAKHMKGINPCP